jgi:hypothetical protein
VTSVDSDGAGVPGSADKTKEGEGLDAANDTGAAACFTGVRVGVARGRVGAWGGATGTLAVIAGATIAPDTEGAAGRRRLGASGIQRAAAERVRTKPAA